MNIVNYLLTNHNKSNFEGRKEADLGVEEGDGIDDLHRAAGAGGAPEEDGVDGGCSVL